MALRYYSPTSAAEALDLSRMTVWRLIRDGKIRAVNVSSSAKPRWRISEDDLRSYMDSLASGALRESA